MFITCKNNIRQKPIELMRILNEQVYSSNHPQLDVMMDGIVSKVHRINSIDMRNNSNNLYFKLSDQ